MDLALPVILFTLATMLMLGLLGSTRRIGFWGAILSFVLLTPVVGFVVVLLSGPRRRQRPVKVHGKKTTAAAE